MKKHITDRLSISGKQKTEISKEVWAMAIAELEENGPWAHQHFGKLSRQAIRGEILVKIRNILSKSNRNLQAH